MKHSSLPRRIILVLAGTLALPALAVGQYLHDYCPPDQSESRFFSHYDPKTVEWFNVDPLMNLFA